MAFRSVAGLGAAVLMLAGGVAMAAPADPRSVTDLDGVTVVAALDVRVSVAVGGDMAEDTFVSSAPGGMTCGGAEYQYRTQENRQCWLRIRRNSVVLLTAQARGHYGRDWTVEWIGCEPLANGAACQLKAQDESQVAALFTRR